MTSIWDLLPASAWPVQPFVWPFDPTQPSPGPQTVSSQPSASAAPRFGWAPAAAASGPAFGWASASPAPPNAPAYSGAADPDAFLAAFPHAEVDPARTARLAADARRAYEFTRWAFGPPSRPAGQTRELAAGPDASAGRFAPTAAAAAAVDAPPRPGAMSGLDDAGNRPATAHGPVPANRAEQQGASVGNAEAPPMQAGGTTQPPEVGAATGNPNLKRQGERIRGAAAARNPPPAVVRAAGDRFGQFLHDAITDIPHEIYQAGADALHEMDEGLNPFSSVYRAASDRERRARRTGTPGDVLASEWETHKRHGRSIRGIFGLLGAPITGTARSVLGHALETLPGFTYEDAKQGVDQALMGLGPGRGRLPRAPFEPPHPAPIAPLLREDTGPPASSFMGSRRFKLDPAPYQPNRNTPGELRGVPYSGHAFDQMQNRGLPPIVTDHTMRTGILLPGDTPNTFKLYDPVNGVIVIRNRDTGNVVTVMRSRGPKGLPDDTE